MAVLCSFIFNGVQLVHRRVTGFCALAGEEFRRASAKGRLNFINRMRGSGAEITHPPRCGSDRGIGGGNNSDCEYRAEAAPGKDFGRLSFCMQRRSIAAQEHEPSSDNSLTIDATLLKCQKSLLKRDSRAKVPSI